MSDLYIGLISGTSMDGIDAALVRFGDASLDILQTHAHEYPAPLRERLSAAIHDSSISKLADVASLHRDVGESFRDAAKTLLKNANVDAAAVTAIGSHGQTIRHEPNIESPFSLQIGDPEIIAEGTGIRTIADFRTADIAQGGQGAPLAPAFHEWLFRETGTSRVILNIGGISNVTVLSADDYATTGFDTGPGNTLMDAWCRKMRNEAFDRDGAWSASGTVNKRLLQRLLADAYFAAAAPKSTGFEYFNLDWLERHDLRSVEAADVQATLSELTAVSIADAIRTCMQGECEVLVCGGGVHNVELMRRLAAALPGFNVQSTASAGLDPDWVEAAAFAWLAMRTTLGLPGNLPSVTGAKRATVLGATYNATR
jgi:anhydro-N-acetylmuramic acid kinase